MTSPKELKRHLRKEALGRRDALDPFWRVEAALEMAETARDSIAIEPGQIVSGFWPMRELVRGAPMVDMGFGTVGPHDEAEVLDPQVMLVPLAAFDARGHRIGYGAGYYDRAIARLVDKGQPPRLIGIAFDCQEVALVPDEPHDMIIPEILTENGLRRFAPKL
ncbi:MAG: 5-formyltetrahydrofolate cyclo-ligase [Mesorhizobium sp.]|nr:MAG: 5-formyltetrahydrofolate cyclo-ligase [Mesorhizobium sp.]